MDKDNIKLKKLLKEIEKRKHSPLMQYNKGNIVHHKQMLFHKCQYRNRWVFGGNRSGKTECGAVETVWLLRGIHPYRENKPNLIGWCVSLTQTVQREVAQKKILYYLDKSWIEKVVMQSGEKDAPEYGVIDYILVKNVFGGLSKLVFRTCGEARERFQGSDLDFVWFDEEPPESIYEECRMRLIDREGIIYGTMTPLKGFSWVYDKIFLKCGESKELWCEFMEWDDNPFLPKEETEMLSETMSKDELIQRKYGKFSGSSGLVYPEFEPSVNVIEPFVVPKDYFVGIAADPGLSNPFSCHWYAMDYDGNIFVIREHYARNKPIDFHCDEIKRISNELGWEKTKDGKLRILIDSAAEQHTLSGIKSVRELMDERGIIADTKVNKDLFTGIMRVKALLKDGNNKAHLFVFSNCVNMIREFKTYRYGNMDRPVKENDHAMDELRYFIMNRMKLKIKKPMLSEIQKDKQNLIRNAIWEKYQ